MNGTGGWMNRTGEWMNGGSGAPEWIWVVIGTLVVVLLVVAITKLVGVKT